MRRLLQILRETEAAEIAEAAMVLPLVFMFLMGSVWFGRAFNIYSTITQAAQQGAVTAARPSCATCPPGGGWSGNTSFPSDTTVGNAVASVLQASSIDPNNIPVSPSPGLSACPSPPAPSGGGCNAGPYNIWICRAVQLNPAQPVQCGTVVSFQYPFQFYLPFTSLSMQQITMSAQAESRMEN